MGKVEFLEHLDAMRKTWETLAAKPGESKSEFYRGVVYGVVLAMRAVGAYFTGV